MYKKGLGIEIGIKRREIGNSRSPGAESLITVWDQSHQLIYLLCKKNQTIIVLKISRVSSTFLHIAHQSATTYTSLELDIDSHFGSNK